MAAPRTFRSLLICYQPKLASNFFFEVCVGAIRLNGEKYGHYCSFNRDTRPGPGRTGSTDICRTEDGPHMC